MINLGLSRITALVAQLPTYQTWKAIHIAGTNGKGSVAAYLSSLFLRLSKPSDPDTELKIGRFTSPHLIDRWDCITINDQPVSESLFLQVENQVKSYASKVEHTITTDKSQKHKSHNSYNGDNESPTVTEFELLTATAFEIFSQQKCQVAIIECGLGGRLDATNVLNATDVACSVITKIGLDHIGVLGNTIQAIAREKAGIVKKGVHMIVDGTNSFDVIEAIAIIANSSNVAPTLSRQPEVEDMWNINKDDKIVGKLPSHQYNNLVLALTAFTKSQELLQSLKFTSPSSSILPQILTDMRTSYPARLQHLTIKQLAPKYTKPILLDGAHNPQSAEVLRSYVDSLASVKSGLGFFSTRFAKARDPKPRTWILAMSQGKETHKILNTLLEKHDHVVTCGFGRVDGMPWITPQEPSELARTARSIVEKGSVIVTADIIEAVEAAVSNCKGMDRDERGEVGKGEIEIIVAGSLYLASDLLRALRDGPESVKERFDIGVAL